MGNLIGASVFAAIVLVYLGWRVRIRMQKVPAAVEKVVRQLRVAERDPVVNVRTGGTYPLSDDMIKVVAAAEGYSFLKVGQVNRGRSLQFQRGQR